MHVVYSQRRDNPICRGGGGERERERERERKSSLQAGTPSVSWAEKLSSVVWNVIQTSQLSRDTIITYGSPWRARRARRSGFIGGYYWSIVQTSLRLWTPNGECLNWPWYLNCLCGLLVDSELARSYMPVNVTARVYEKDIMKTTY